LDKAVSGGDLYISVLMAEDFEPFRQLLSSILETNRRSRLICEVADGLEAVEKADELDPDLILLDIGMPKLNGIEAAGRVSQVSLNRKSFSSPANSLLKSCRERWQLAPVAMSSRSMLKENC
jgi:CheY-like chemotaxis protein